jgi:hypothetical protein
MSEMQVRAVLAETGADVEIVEYWGGALNMDLLSSSTTLETMMEVQRERKALWGLPGEVS